MYTNGRDSKKAEEGKQPEFLTNLNELALSKEHNPLIGRQQELAKVSSALRRKGMRGTVLVGDAGVGKTALIEGLAYLLANDALPELAGREIYSLDVGSMWGQPENKFVGQLHKHLNDALKFIAAQPDKRVLFIDEIHQSARRRGKSQVVVHLRLPTFSSLISVVAICNSLEQPPTTSIQGIIEGDRAIVDRLLRIDIDEPSSEETLRILRGIKEDYEQHHNITIPWPLL